MPYNPNYHTEWAVPTDGEDSPADGQNGPLQNVGDEENWGDLVQHLVSLLDGEVPRLGPKAERPSNPDVPETGDYVWYIATDTDPPEVSLWDNNTSQWIPIWSDTVDVETLRIRNPVNLDNLNLNYWGGDEPAAVIRGEMLIQMGDDDAAAGTSGYASKLSYVTEAGARMATTAADKVHGGHWGVYTTANDINEDVDYQPEKRFNIQAGSPEVNFDIYTANNFQIRGSSIFHRVFADAGNDTGYTLHEDGYFVGGYYWDASRQKIRMVALSSDGVSETDMIELDGVNGEVEFNGHTLTEFVLPADSIGTAEIAASAVTAPEIGTGAVNSDAIQTDAVGSPEIAASAVNSSELAADSVGSSELQTDSVGSDEFVSGANVDIAGNAASADTADRLEPGGTTYREEDANSPWTVSSAQASTTYTIDGDYDRIHVDILRAASDGNTVENLRMRINGDSGNAYDFITTSGTRQTSQPYLLLANHNTTDTYATGDLQILTSGTQNHVPVIGPAGFGGGGNDFLTGHWFGGSGDSVNSIELYYAAGNINELTARVFGENF